MVPGARAYGSVLMISSPATQRAPRRALVVPPASKDARKDAVTTLELVSASEDAPTSLQLIALALSALRFEL